MLFNEECFDQYFHKIIEDTRDAFPFAVLRQETTIDPDTRSACLKYRVVDSGIANWSTPNEPVKYDLDGVIMATDAVIFVKNNANVKQQDLIYRSDRDIFLRVMGISDYGSHYDLDCVMKEVGSNFSPLSDVGPIHTAYITSDVAPII